MAERWKKSPQELPADHPAWTLEAHYLGLAVVNVICALSPGRIILGGGVMSQPRLLPMVRAGVQELLNKYVQSPAVLDQIEQYIVAPGLGDRSGVLGALALAELARP
jgi:fructokinase